MADISSNNPILELKQIVRFFPPNRRILNRISLTLREGETVRILGRSGSGKTLLTDILTGKSLPDSGDVYFNGSSIRSMTESERRKLRLQEFAILGREPGFLRQISMLDNVSLPLLLTGETGKIPRRRAMDAMEKMEIDNASSRKLHQLSIFEIKKLQLARAELGVSRILVADSFTSGLTLTEEKEIWELLEWLQMEKNSTLIHLTDDIGGAGMADRTWHLENGYLLE